jgi:hypothetical protein
MASRPPRNNRRVTREEVRYWIAELGGTSDLPRGAVSRLARQTGRSHGTIRNHLEASETWETRPADPAPASDGVEGEPAPEGGGDTLTSARSLVSELAQVVLHQLALCHEEIEVSGLPLGFALRVHRYLQASAREISGPISTDPTMAEETGEGGTCE